MGLFKKIYYDVPPCPKCGSPVTGRYIKRPILDPDKMLKNCLQNGELVTLTDGMPEKNLYCDECGYRWHGIVMEKWLTQDEILDQVEIRGTADLYNEFESSPREQSSIAKLIRWFI